MRRFNELQPHTSFEYFVGAYICPTESVSILALAVLVVPVLKATCPMVRSSGRRARRSLRSSPSNISFSHFLSTLSNQPYLFVTLFIVPACGMYCI